LKVADYFVVATGQSRAHVRGIYEELHVRLKALGEHHLPVQGADLGWWVVLDYSDVVVHILQPDARSFYDLDRLYDECPRVPWSELAPPRALSEERAAEV
jgi:ribosome-associated protein